jgi:hypothetical protein
VVFRDHLKRKITALSLFLLILAGCGGPSPSHWSEMIPDATPFVIVPQEGAGLGDMMGAEYMPMFDDISPSAIQLVSNLEEYSENNLLTVQAMLLYPDTANDWQPIWITRKVNGLLPALKNSYQRRFEQNNYNFENHTIEKLFIGDREIFVIEVGSWMVFSESSLGIEHILRTISGTTSAMKIDRNSITPGTILMNTPSLERWIQQVAQVSHRPNLMNLFQGAGPFALSFNSSEDADWNWQMTGSMPLESGQTPLVRSISSAPGSFTLDRYISVNTAGFGIFRLEPRRVPIDGLEVRNDTDRFIEENPDIWQRIAGSMESEFAFATFAESGAASASEYLYLRKINNAGEIRSQLNRLSDEGLAIRSGNTYSVNSSWLAKLFGSELNPMTDFYITVYRDVVAMAIRNGLAESVGGDAERRRVMYYDDDYMEVRNSLPSGLSSLFYVDAGRFGTYIQPWLYPQNYFNMLIAGLDQFVITTRKNSDNSSLEVAFTSFERETVDRPYRENWIFPLGGSDITGKPVMADISGSNRDEIIFSTVNGNVYALATDGTTVLQLSTEGDRPIGSPVVYDWYGNNQNVIMQAAGNRIYAWNDNGALLPNFPFELSDDISTPLTVMDITRNGVAEIIVATSDRRMHILNARGRALSGWPRSTNAVVITKPLITELRGQRSVFAFAENALHAWEVNGSDRRGFPVFLPAQMSGSPAQHRDHLVGSGLDGSLYSVGLTSLFSDTLSSTHASDSLYVQSIQLSNSSLNSTPSSHSVLMRDEEGFFREEMILTQSSNGSVFLYNSNGDLRFTRTMGQPSSGSFAPFVVDIDRNQRNDIVALADFGRLYAWDILSGDRLYDLPTTGMRHVVIRDLTGNGNNEIIAHTRDGIRSWTVLRTRRESTPEGITPLQ